MKAKKGNIMTIETANRLYELRKKQGLSQEELAEKLGVSRQAVSKWERSEASPDTDNLIALAKIYDMTLDELIYGKKESNEKAEETNNKSEYEPQNDETIIHADNDTNVKIGPTGILVESNDGDRVEINLSGIKINKKGIDFESDDEDDFDDDEKEIIHMSNGKAKIWLSIPYPIICGITYILFGCLDICGGWGQSWIIFTTIPLYYTLIEAIFKKRFSVFAYPVFTAFAYLFAGLYLNNWHPSWIVFLTIPIYYPIAHALDKLIKEKEESIVK